MRCSTARVFVRKYNVQNLSRQIKYNCHLDTASRSLTSSSLSFDYNANLAHIQRLYISTGVEHGFAGGQDDILCVGKPQPLQLMPLGLTRARFFIRYLGVTATITAVLRQSENEDEKDVLGWVLSQS